MHAISDQWKVYPSIDSIGHGMALYYYSIFEEIIRFYQPALVPLSSVNLLSSLPVEIIRNLLYLTLVGISV